MFPKAQGLIDQPDKTPAWLPLYVLTEDGWYPTFPRWLFDNHPPRGN